MRRLPGGFIWPLKRVDNRVEDRVDRHIVDILALLIPARDIFEGIDEYTFAMEDRLQSSKECSNPLFRKFFSIRVIGAPVAWVSAIVIGLHIPQVAKLAITLLDGGLD